VTLSVRPAADPFANAGVHPSGRRESAEQSQAVREPAGRVPEFWPGGDGCLQHGVGHDARLFGSCHHLLDPLVHGRANLAIVIELGVGFQEVRVERRLLYRRAR
jgi:hypothetical protein